VGQGDRGRKTLDTQRPRVTTAVVRPPRVAVIGAGEATSAEREMAEALGAELARLGAVVLCGGRSGVMEAVARGASASGGLTVGILPGDEAESANPWIQVPLASGMGEARNALVIRAAEAVVAVGGSWGTLSEIALAKKIGRPVAVLGEAPAEGLGLVEMSTPETAAEWAVSQARRSNA
jgi:uncharacterized protein (TIGR00725 family)